MENQTLSELLKYSDGITQILASIKSGTSKNGQIDGFGAGSGDSSKMNGGEVDPFEVYEQSHNLRNAFRVMVDGIEANRELVQIKKEKIEKSKVFLEGLQYYKATLKAKIADAQTGIVQLGSDYLQEEPTQDSDWIEGYEQIQNNVLGQIKESQEQKNALKSKLQKKQDIKRQVAESREKYTKLYPQQVRKLHSQVLETGKIFHMKEVDSLGTSKFKSRQLDQIHTLLFPLMLKGIVSLNQISSGNLDTNSEHTIEELEVTIQSIQSEISSNYEFARLNKVNIQQKPFKFYIACIATKSQTKIALSVFRREDFTTEEVFSRLILREPLSAIYDNPASEFERNTNNKYVHFRWISEVLASPSNLIKGLDFVNIIKERLFCLYLQKYLIQNSTKKTLPFFFSLIRVGEDSHSSIDPLIQNKRIFFSKFEKCSFQTYKKTVFVPEWVEKALNKFMIIELSQPRTEFERRQRETASHHMKDMYGYLEQNGLEDLKEQGTHQYYKFELYVDKNCLHGFFIIPFEYPSKKSMIKLTHFERKSGRPTKHHEKSQTELRLNISEKLQLSDSFTPELAQVESEINHKVADFLEPEGAIRNEHHIQKKDAFYLLLQLNRLLSFVAVNHEKF